MARIYFLFDASAASHYYIDFDPYKDILTILFAKRAEGKAFFYLPTFCVAETFNIFAKYHYRRMTIDGDTYRKAFDTFAEHIHDRKVFYCYDLNRYHNLNLNWRKVYEIEHKTDTEYERLGINPKTTSDREAKRLYHQRFPDSSLGRHYLSGFDLLILGMAIELMRNLGEKVYLVTRDERLVKIAQLVEVAEPGTEKPHKLKVINLGNTGCLNQVKSIFGLPIR